MNKKVKILMTSAIAVLALTTKAYCAESGTTRMKINDEATWININVSEAYKECESLNSTSSTLGTSALKAHLTTDYDWSAMAIFSVSQYGAATKNELGTSSTTNNKSGIYDISRSKANKYIT